MRQTVSTIAVLFAAPFVLASSVAVVSAAPGEAPAKEPAATAPAKDQAAPAKDQAQDQAKDAARDGAPQPAPPAQSTEAPVQQIPGRADPAQAIAAYTEALKDTGLANDRRATFLNDRAVAYTRTGQIKLALEDFNRAVQLFAEYPAAYNNRGNLLLSVGQHAEAIKDFDRAILLAPGYAAAHSNRANARLKLGQTAEAVIDFTRAIELMPASAPPLSGRGLVHLATGRPHAAIRDFSRAVNADARFASAYRNRATARLDIGQSDEAIEDLSRAIAFDINNPEIYVLRGYAYLNAANAASAIKDFTRAVELNPASVQAYQARGLAHGIADAFDEAYADLNRAIELDPRSAVTFAFRAFVYKQNQQGDVAVKDIETALKLDANSAEVQWANGEIEEVRGRPDAAIVSLRKALELRPGWRLAEDALKRLGAGTDLSEDRLIAGAGTGSWRVVMQRNAYFAVSDDYPGLRVALEMMGEGQPKLLEWELKKPPHKGYGVLRFSGGRVITKNGPEDTELAAIADIENAKVVSIQPHRQGQRTAGWTWEQDRVQIASIDGVTDEFALRSSKPDETPVAAVPVAPKRSSASASKNAGWSPWNTPFGTGQPERREPKRQQAQKRAPKPKSLFDLLFN